MIINPRCLGRAQIVLQVIVSIVCSAGCQIHKQAYVAQSDFRSAQNLGQVVWPTEGSTGERAVHFLKLANFLSESNDARSVDYYFQAASLSWGSIAAHLKPVNPSYPSWEIYQICLRGLVADAARFHRFQSSGTLKVFGPSGPIFVPVTSSSLDWPSDRLHGFQLPVDSHHRKLERYFVRRGLGVPVLAFRTKPTGIDRDPVERFFPEQLPLSATLLLRSVGSRQSESPDDVCSEVPSEFVIELANPLRLDSIQVNSTSVPLAKDLSAPLEYQLRNRPANPLSGFIFPGSGTQNDGLRWVEPYQPGKIPLVLIHGLMSDPTTWMDMLNELRTLAWFNERYQVWGFSYATGSPFVTSAMRLRNQCREALTILDPYGEDPSLRQMVMVGHSMGGLLAKLQVTDSDDQVWNSVSNVPLEQIRASMETKQELEQRLFFTAQPYVKRVIYIATPHQGSSFASRGVGKLFSSLVRPDEQNQSLHRRLVSDNPNAFSGTFRKRIPTSIDLLDPNDRTLEAIYNLRVPLHVRQHTVLGTGNGPWTLGWNDGVVPVSSASHPCAVSELDVDACHTNILKNDATISEVIRLLHVHVTEAGCPR